MTTICGATTPTYANTPYDTLLFDGVDLQTIPGVIVRDWSGLLAPGNRRGSDDTIPDRNGAVGARLPYDAYNFGIPIGLAGRTNFERLTVLKALAAALAGDHGLGQLEWRQDDGAGGYVPLTAAGRFTAFNAFQLLQPKFAMTELSFTNLDGAWRTSDGLWVLA